jgi:hypothetical protein
MIYESFFSNPVIILLGALNIGLLIYFVIRFFLPSIRLKKDLAGAIEVLHIMVAGTEKVDLGAISRDAMKSKKLSHIWKEFSETLHGQTAPDDHGQEQVIKWRSTIPADVFFNFETLIAVELRTEYFKHQPGIFTGIGIIGTFSGLLNGLSEFSVSSDPEIVRRSLDVLIHGVFEAFIVSATAITLAMITTWLEKTSVTHRIMQVEELCQLLDSLFESGAGEEYLARLVKAGENSATQTAQLKDALVSDLKQMLVDLTNQQTEAIASSFRESSRVQIETTEKIANAISDSLTDPLKKIAAAVNITTDKNGEVVTRALNEALIAFSQKLEDMFGGQMGNMNHLLQQTTASMQATVARFDELANDLGDAGRNAADAMGERLSTALEAMEQRQLALNTTMSDFVNQLRDMVKSSQSETNAQLQQSMQLIGNKIAQMTDHLEKQSRMSSDSHSVQQALIAENAKQVATQLAAQVQASQTAMQEQLTAMLAVLREQTTLINESTAKQQRQFVEDGQRASNEMADRVGQSLIGLEEKMAGLIDTLINQNDKASQSHHHILKLLSEQASQLEIQSRMSSDSHSVQQALMVENAKQVATQFAAQVQVSQTAMQEQLTAMLAVLRDQTNLVNESTAKQQRQFVEDGQRASNEMADRVGQSLIGLEEKMAGLIDTLINQNDKASQSHQHTQNLLSEQASQLIKTLGQQVKDLTSQVSNAVNSMQDSVKALRDVSTESSRRIEGSSQTLSLAADNFAKAGNSVNSVMQQTSAVSEKMVSTSATLNQASGAVETALNNYSEAGKTMLRMIEELKATVVVARRDASVSESLVEQIRLAAEHLKIANTEVNGVFEKVCEELANAHEAFANNIENSLKRGNTAYQKELKDAIDYLKSAIEELGEVAEKIPSRG